MEIVATAVTSAHGTIPIMARWRDAVRVKIGRDPADEESAHLNLSALPKDSEPGQAFYPVGDVRVSAALPARAHQVDLWAGGQPLAHCPYAHIYGRGSTFLAVGRGQWRAPASIILPFTRPRSLSPISNARFIILVYNVEP